MDKNNILIKLPTPGLQVDFAMALTRVNDLYLQRALSKTVERANLSTLDNQLNAMVPANTLSALAGRGLRGELLFAVPYIFELNPKLLGYYRLLLGFSQKSFYTKENGLTSFKTMEEKGILLEKNKSSLNLLCKALIKCATELISGIGNDIINQSFLHDLTVLTLGAQLRGGANVRKGSAAIVKVFDTIKKIVKHSVVNEQEKLLLLTNAANRKVIIKFAPDPDIIIQEEMSENNYRNVIAIEIKGGKDFSNIHNRIGEAEKSHQKARKAGFVECWTVVNVDNINLEMAKAESPSTDRFYLMSKIKDTGSEEYADFYNRIIALTGIRRDIT
jgi:hypothetical protein